jgi:hypothetical protein
VLGLKYLSVIVSGLFVLYTYLDAQDSIIPPNNEIEVFA